MRTTLRLASVLPSLKVLEGAEDWKQVIAHIQQLVFYTILACRPALF